MPNWCECDLFVEGPKAKVQEFLDLVKSDESPFDFDRVVPYPEHLRELDRLAEEWHRKNPPPWGEEVWASRPKDGYNQGGYEWCWKNWGTKWNAKDVEVGDAETWRAGGGAEHARVEVNFATAWSPPKPVIERASARFPELTFDLRYFERGQGFNGKFVCEKGAVEADECGDYFGNRGG